MRDQVWPIRIAGSVMGFVPEPCGLTFLTPTGCGIIRGMHHVLGCNFTRQAAVIFTV